MKKVIKLFSSLKLTIAGLAGVMILVFLGTIEQVSTGIAFAQEKYFRSFFVHGTPLDIPYFPGGYFFGILLLLNLSAAYWARFRLSVKKSGILLIHSGIGLLIVGELVNGLYSQESQIPIRVGEIVNYSDQLRETELVVVDTSHSEYDHIVSIPTSLLKPGKTVELPTLPLRLRTRLRFYNAKISMPEDQQNLPPSYANRGIGTRINVEPLPLFTGDDQLNAFTACVEVMEQERSLGCWLLSNAIPIPQSFVHKEKHYELFIRRKRNYFPFSIELVKFKHISHPGTTIPKEFSSLVNIYDAEGRFERKVEISMNQPLRFQGKSFYQASFGEENNLSVLQVVENPARSLPYLASAMVGIGLLLQFLISYYYYSKTP